MIELLRGRLTNLARLGLVPYNITPAAWGIRAFISVVAAGQTTCLLLANPAA